jgi:hexulose-6-phosphate isomerase
MDDRRTFLKSLAAVVGTATPLLAQQTTAKPAAAQGAAAKQMAPPNPAALKKSTLLSMLPRNLSYADRFAMAKEAGFEAIEIGTVNAEPDAVQIRDAAKAAGLRIHSVMNSDHWRYPLSSSDPEVVNRCVKGMETSLHNAALWGADAVLLVPAVVDAKTSYRDAWTRSQKIIRERLIPMAKDLKVVIAVEEVWNKFLLSPLEFARYVDEFESPWVRAYFDVGNVVFYGFPQDWIRTLGSRIVKIHLKDFTVERSGGRFIWKALGEGDIDWPEVRSALAEVGYSGYITTELNSVSDVAALKEVSSRVDRIIAGEKPVAAAPSAGAAK